jgi:hypothetical protein
MSIFPDSGLTREKKSLRDTWRSAGDPSWLLRAPSTMTLEEGLAGQGASAVNILRAQVRWSGHGEEDEHRRMEDMQPRAQVSRARPVPDMLAGRDEETCGDEGGEALALGRPAWFGLPSWA